MPLCLPDAGLKFKRFVCTLCVRVCVCVCSCLSPIKFVHDGASSHGFPSVV
jgi:hypothetical protein